MAYHSRLKVWQTLIDDGLLPIFYNPDVKTSKNVIDACVAGGVRVIEFTNRGNFAIDVFSALRKHYAETHPDLIFGVGSIIDESTASLYIAKGADFIVSPTFNADVATLCNRRRVPYVPGCFSPTEISDAEALGCEMVKLFPANVATSGFIKSVLGPMPQTRFVITGGVKAEEASIKSWFDAGANVVGMGSALITRHDLASGDFSPVAERCKNTLAWIQKYKKA